MFQEMDTNGQLFNLKDFAFNESQAINNLGAQTITNTYGTYYKAGSSGIVQAVISSALTSNSFSGQFHVALNKSANLNVAADEFYWSSNSGNFGFDLAQVRGSSKLYILMMMIF